MPEEDRANWKRLLDLIESEKNKIELGMVPIFSEIRKMFNKLTTGSGSETAQRWLRKLRKHPQYKYENSSCVSNDFLNDISMYIDIRISV